MTVFMNNPSISAGGIEKKGRGKKKGTMEFTVFKFGFCFVLFPRKRERERKKRHGGKS